MWMWAVTNLWAWENLRYRYIAAVDDPQARVKGINFKGNIVPSI